MTESADLPEPLDQGIVLQKLSERHRMVASLLAQGVPRLQIAQICKYTPQYVTDLQRQPLFIEYVRTMNEGVATQLEALYGRTVDIIAAGLEGTANETQLKAARLQLEATHRIGRFADRAPGEAGADRLEQLADRLTDLLKRKKENVNGRVFEAEVVGTEVGPRSLAGGG